MALKRSILIADDHEENRLVLGELFERHGYGVEFAGDGVEAVRIARMPRVRLAIMDYQMPGLTGIEALRILREERCATPVLIMTSQSSPRVARDAMACGAQGFFRKPLDLPVLRQVAVKLAGVETSITVYRISTTIVVKD